MPETVKIISNSYTNNWNPVIGSNTEKILNKVFNDDDESKDKVCAETYAIMQKCGDPLLETFSDIGLVYGYIQSGKTLSFTTLAAMARDNDYQMIIVIAGVTTNLLDQSFKRLNNDLDTRNNFNKQWEVIKIQSSNEADDYINIINRNMELWRHPDSPSKPTILITVMKQTDNLRMLKEILEDIDLKGVPALIIDDEGDQASLNNEAFRNNKRAENKEVLKYSAIYRDLISLRKQVPHHTFLQYTATPQANVFIDLDDEMSPNFISLVSPGAAYTGGKQFFIDSPYTIETITDLEKAEDEGIIPLSLKHALQQFFIGVSDGYIIGEVCNNPENRTMMIHPSRVRADHQSYKNRVTEITESWIEIIQRSDNDETKVELISEFKIAYESIKKNAPDINDFQKIIDKMFYVISQTKIITLNIDNNDFDIKELWNHYSQILIGGDKLSRGFTVEGLTVTYMPRNLGVGNSDTFQQRARFFGYRSHYLNMCKVWLKDESITGFKDYVKAEEDWRANLSSFVGRDLNLWKRSLRDVDNLNFTRREVLSQKIKKYEFGDHWVSSVFLTSTSEYQSNKNILDAFIQKNQEQLKEDSGHELRSENVKHDYFELPLKDLYEDFLKNFKFNDQDKNFIKVVNHLENFLQYEGRGNNKTRIYRMKKGSERLRSSYNLNKIKFLHQGKNYLDPSDEETIVYPGDAEIFDKNKISLQIHNISLKENGSKHISLAIRLTPEFALKLIELED